MPNSGKLSVGWLYDDSLDTDDGVSQYVKTLGAWMSGQGHQVSYLVGETKIREWRGGTVYPLAKNLNVRWNKNRMSVPIKPRLKSMNQLLARQAFDVVHTTLPYSPLMAQRVINKLPKDTALVGTWHIYPASRSGKVGSKLLRPLYGRSLARFDEFVSVSQVASNYAKETFHVESSVIPNVVDIMAMTPRKTLIKRKPRVVFLGRLVKRKGVHKLIDAAAYLRDNLDFQNFEVIIAGAGPDRQRLESQVRRHNLSECIRFIGYVEEADKPALLASADVACFPALYGESFGVVLIEAMAAGAKVVLGGDNPGYRGVLAEQPDLLVDVDAKEPKVLADKLHFWLTSQAAIEAVNSWQTEEIKRYDVNVVGPLIIELYRRAIARRQASRHN